MIRMLLLEAAARLVRRAAGDTGSFVIVHNAVRRTTSITTGLHHKDAEILQDAAARMAESNLPDPHTSLGIGA